MSRFCVAVLLAGAAHAQLCKDNVCPHSHIGAPAKMDPAKELKGFGHSHLWRKGGDEKDWGGHAHFNRAGYYWDFSHAAARRADSTAEAKCDCRPGYHVAKDITCRIDAFNHVRVAHPMMRCSGRDMSHPTLHGMMKTDVCAHRHWTGTTGVTYHHCKRTGPKTCECCDCSNGLHHRCPAGKHRPSQTDGTCVDCAAGRYTDEGNDLVACKQCAAGRYTDATGRTACDACAQGQYQPALGTTACADCAKGRFQDVLGQTNCKACGKGRYQGAVGQNGCPTCDAGTFAAAMATVACAPCGAEAWQPKGGQDHCRAAEQCDGNEYETKDYTATSDRVCASHTVCNAKRQYMTKAAGTHHDRECARCPPGMYCDGLTKTDCAKGTAHDGVGDDLSFCPKCAAGRYAGGAGWEQCKACPEGFYEPSEGQPGCRECELGEYGDAKGLAKCKLCAEGQFAAARGHLSCADCAAGKYQSAEGGSSCADCAAGTVAPFNGTDTCAACGAEAWQDVQGQLACKAATTCESDEWQKELYTATTDRICVGHTTCAYPDADHAAGEYHTTDGGTHVDRVCASLTTCDYDSQWEAVLPTHSSNRVCKPLTTCTAAQYESTPKTKTSDRACSTLLTCVAGRYQTAAPTWVASDPSAPQGHYTANRQCDDCGTGTYQDAQNALSCPKCAAGKYRNGADKSSAETVACTACEQGRYQPAAGKLSCTACAAGKHRVAAAASSSDEVAACVACEPVSRVCDYN